MSPAPTPRLDLSWFPGEYRLIDPSGRVIEESASFDTQETPEFWRQWTVPLPQGTLLFKLQTF